MIFRIFILTYRLLFDLLRNDAKTREQFNNLYILWKVIKSEPEVKSVSAEGVKALYKLSAC